MLVRTIRKAIRNRTPLAYTDLNGKEQTGVPRMIIEKTYRAMMSSVSKQITVFFSPVEPGIPVYRIKGKVKEEYK